MPQTPDRPYVPQVGVPTVVFLTALSFATALPTAFIVQGQTPPVWLTAVTFAVLLAAVVAVPAMNARARPSDRRARRLNTALLIGAVLVPALLLIVGTAASELGWLMALAVGVQLGLLAGSGALAARGRER